MNNSTFIGDFDLEYLLNKSGTIRLKAYNHYNDRNYYIKSALTTQGVGILLRHDFDRWGNIFKKKSPERQPEETPQEPTTTLPTDTVATPPPAVNIQPEEDTKE